jgi:ACT domain-containing protein
LVARSIALRRPSALPFQAPPLGRAPPPHKHAKSNKYKQAQKKKGSTIMKAVITVTGKDSVGIIAEVATVCATYNVNILDVTQSIIQDYFAMIMLADIEKLSVAFAEFSDILHALGERKHLEIHSMHEDIFNTMHHI